MKRKETSEFTKEEKDMMDTIAVNYILAQADGFQLGYAQALKDFTNNIIDYWRGSDDKPQESILDTLVDLGVELGKRREIARKNFEMAENKGYVQYYNWGYKPDNSYFEKIVSLYTRFEEEETEDKNADSIKYRKKGRK